MTRRDEFVTPAHPGASMLDILLVFVEKFVGFFFFLNLLSLLATLLI